MKRTLRSAEKKEESCAHLTQFPPLPPHIFLGVLHASESSRYFLRGPVSLRSVRAPLIILSYNYPTRSLRKHLRSVTERPLKAGRESLKSELLKSQRK